MKKIFYTLVVALCAMVLMAGGIDKVVAKVTETASLASKANVSTTTKVTGYINRIDFTFLTNTLPIDSVILASSNSLTSIKTTFMTLTQVATNVSYMLTNYVQRACVLDEVFYLNTTNNTVTNQSVQATIIYERP